MKLNEFLTDYNWCHGVGENSEYYAQDDDGNPVHYRDPMASRFTLMGAMHVVYPDDTYWQVQDKYASLIRVLHGQKIKDFNDSCSWDDMKHILETIDA